MLKEILISANDHNLFQIIEKIDFTQNYEWEKMKNEKMRMKIDLISFINSIDSFAYEEN